MVPATCCSACSAYCDGIHQDEAAFALSATCGVPSPSALTCPCIERHGLLKPGLDGATQVAGLAIAADPGVGFQLARRLAVGFQPLSPQFEKFVGLRCSALGHTAELPTVRHGAGQRMGGEQ